MVNTCVHRDVRNELIQSLVVHYYCMLEQKVENFVLDNSSNGFWSILRQVLSIEVQPQPFPRNFSRCRRNLRVVVNHLTPKKKVSIKRLFVQKFVNSFLDLIHTSSSDNHNINGLSRKSPPNSS